jgi:hypothetical protein
MQPVSQPTAANPPPAATSTSEATAPSGWETYTSQRCEFALSYPPEMEAMTQAQYSWILGVAVENHEEAARNFIYVSVIPSELGRGGDENIYNYYPEQAADILNMQVGESKSLSSDANMAPFYTYTRQADATIAGQAAKKYENPQPFEFPTGTKEIRYYLQVEDCMYLIGGYMDTTGSTQPGAMTEDLFNQIVASFRPVP